MYALEFLYRLSKRNRSLFVVISEYREVNSPTYQTIY